MADVTLRSPVLARVRVDVGAAVVASGEAVDLAGAAVAQAVAVANLQAGIRLVGPAVSATQAAATLLRGVNLGGAAVVSAPAAATLAVDPNWTAPSLTIDIPVGSTLSRDLSPYLANYNPALHQLSVTAGALPAGITVDSANSELDVSGAQVLDDNHVVTLTIVDNADADFQRRITQSNAIRSFGFNSPADLGGVYGDNYGTVPGANGSLQLDTSIKASGASSLRFGIGTNGCNWNWFTNFSPDLSELFGENSEFYIQWKLRIGQSVFEDWGHKYVLIGAGDDGATIYSSCTDLELEVEPWANTRPVTAENQFPIMYNACPGSCGGVFVFNEQYGAGNWKLQNAMPDPFCLYSDALKAGCMHVVPDQWMVFQVGVQLGPRITANNNAGDGPHYWFSNSRVRLWIQQSPTAPEILVSDWQMPQTPGSQPGICAGHGATGNKRFGKIWLLPYTQNSVASPRTGSVWYDELIIGRQKVPAALA